MSNETRKFCPGNSGVTWCDYTPTNGGADTLRGIITAGNVGLIGMELHTLPSGHWWTQWPAKIAAVALGSIRTAKKAASSAANGRKGGRPATAIKNAARLHCNDLMMMGQKATKQDAYDWPAENLPAVKGATTDKIREALAKEIERLAN